jgi:hypothetical protein
MQNILEKKEVLNQKTTSENAEINGLIVGYEHFLLLLNSYLSLFLNPSYHIFFGRFEKSNNNFPVEILLDQF